MGAGTLELDLHNQIFAHPHHLDVSTIRTQKRTQLFQRAVNALGQCLCVWDRIHGVNLNRRCRCCRRRGKVCENVQHSVGETGNGFCRFCALLQGGGPACITGFANGLDQWQLSQEWGARSFCIALHPIAAKQVILALWHVWRREIRHVFDQAQDRNIDALQLEHRDPFAGISQRNVLGCTDYDYATQWDQLHQRKVHIASTWRQVNQHVIELTPVAIGKQLPQGLGCHGAPPNYRLIGVGKKTDAQHLDSMGLYRANHGLAPFFNGLGLLSDHVEHGRHARPVDVRVHQSNFVSAARQLHSHIRRHGALSHATLAAGNRNDVLHARQHLARFQTALVRSERNHLDLRCDGDPSDWYRASQGRTPPPLSCAVWHALRGLKT